MYNISTNATHSLSSMPSPGGGHVRHTSTGTDAPWTNHTTVSNHSLNRKERRKKERIKSKADRKRASSQVSLKITSRKSSEVNGLRTKRADLPASTDALEQCGAVTHDEQATWSGWADEVLWGGIQFLQDAVAWNPLGGLGTEGAPVPATTCDVDGSCEPEAPMSMADFRKVARQAFSIETSPSLKKRDDQTLKDVVVLISDVNHDEPHLQGLINSLTGKTARRGDFFLIEMPKGQENDSVCRGLTALGVQCHGIDNSPWRTKLDEARERLVTAYIHTIQLAFGKTLDFPSGSPKPSFDQLKKLGFWTLQKMMKEHAKNLSTRGDSGFSKKEWDELGRLSTASRVAAAEVNRLMPETLRPRDAVMRNEIEHHAANAGGRAIFVSLGSGHVNTIEPWLLETHDAIVLHPKKK